MIMHSSASLSAPFRSGPVCPRTCRAASRVSPVASLCAAPLPRLRGTYLPHVKVVAVSKRIAVLTHAAAPEGSATATLTLVNLISALAKASNAWEKYDKDRNGTLSLEECAEIFNSEEICEAVEMLTNCHCRHFTAEDLEPHFRRADSDRSGGLSRSEFLALYLAVATERVKKNPLLLAEALLGFLDRDRNGVLEGGELKAMLAILGFAPALLMPIPSFMRIEYKAILRTLGGHLERKA